MFLMWCGASQPFLYTFLAPSIHRGGNTMVHCPMRPNEK